MEEEETEGDTGVKIQQSRRHARRVGGTEKGRERGRETKRDGERGTETEGDGERGRERERERQRETGRERHCRREREKGQRLASFWSPVFLKMPGVTVHTITSPCVTTKKSRSIGVS
jgi:hypothetical protein